MKTGEKSETPVTFLDVYQEFNDVIADKYKIMTFKSMVRITRATTLGLSIGTNRTEIKLF